MISKSATQKSAVQLVTGYKMAKIDDIELENLTEVDIDDENATEEPPFQWSDDDENLVDTFMQTNRGKEELKRIQNHMKECFDEEWEAQTEYREQAAADWKAFIGFLEKKTFPYENCANINVPIAYENIIRLAFRMSGELFGDWSDVVGVLPVGPEDTPVTDLMSKHDNWQVTNEIPGFDRQMDKALLKYLLNGDVACHSYYDVVTKTNKHDVLSTDEFLVPNSITSCDPSFADAPFMCRIHHYQDHELYRLKGAWTNVDKYLEKSHVSEEDELDLPMKETHQDVLGTEKPDYPKYNTHKIIQWIGWMDMPDQDRPRYVQGYFYYETGELLQLTIHEQASWEEVERYQSQMADLEQFRAQSQAYREAFSMQEEAQANIDANPLIDDEDKMSMSMGQTAPPPPPIPPTWLGEQDPDNEEVTPPEMEKRPVLGFTHGVLIEPLEGTLGFGFGKLLADLNRAANTVIDQFVDSATQSNVNEIIVPAEVDFEKPFRSRPGAIHKIKNVTGTDLRQSVIVMPKGQANPQMVQLCELLIKWGQSAPQSPDILSGAPGKSGETFRGISIRSEHATKQLSVITRKFSRFVANIYKQNARLNSIFMDEKKFVAINNRELGGLEGIEVGRAMYRRPYDVVFRSDMRYSSMGQKVQEADELLQIAMQVPHLQQMPGFMTRILVKVLEARGESELAMIVKQNGQQAEQAMQQQQAMAQQGQPQGDVPQGGVPQ